MGKVEIVSLLKGSGGQREIDVIIHDSEASVADYFQALDNYILTGDYIRTRSTKSCCEGCDICCKERIPLTSVDVLVLKEKIAANMTMKEFLKRYTYVSIEGKSVDISLARDSQGICLFLDQEAGRCRHYEARPLVCRTYICTSFSKNASELRDIIVNGGEDELVRLWLATDDDAVNTVVHEAFEPDVDPKDWLTSVWTGKEAYAKIKLKDIIDLELWQRLGDGSV